MVKMVTDGLAEVLETAPLYSWRALDLPEVATRFYPDQMTLFCKTCGGKRPFKEHHSSGSMGTPPPLKSEVYSFPIYCGFCHERHYFFVEVDLEGGRIRKIGQVPPIDIDLTKDLAAELGDDAELFKKGNVCLSQGYGLAACAYFRRLLERKVDHILQLLENYLRIDSSTNEEAEKVRALRKGKIADKKLEHAVKYVPVTLVVGGENPVKLLYGQLSVGIHALSEEQCVLLAQGLAETLEFVLLELSRVTATRERFAKNVRSLREILPASS